MRKVLDGLCVLCFIGWAFTVLLAANLAAETGGDQICSGHDLCNVDCRILTTFVCKGGCKNVTNCSVCECTPLVPEPNAKPITCECE